MGWSDLGKTLGWQWEQDFHVLCVSKCPKWGNPRHVVFSGPCLFSPVTSRPVRCPPGRLSRSVSGSETSTWNNMSQNSLRETLTDGSCCSWTATSWRYGGEKLETTELRHQPHFFFRLHKHLQSRCPLQGLGVLSSSDRSVLKRRIKDIQNAAEKERKALDKLEKQKEKQRRKEQEQCRNWTPPPEGDSFIYSETIGWGVLSTCVLHAECLAKTWRCNLFPRFLSTHNQWKLKLLF